MFNYLPNQQYIQFAYPINSNCIYNPYFYLNSCFYSWNTTSSRAEIAYIQGKNDERAVELESASANCNKGQKNITPTIQTIQKIKENSVDCCYIYIQSRNLLPNILNMIFSYIRRINKSGKTVQRIIQNQGRGNKFSAKKYYSYQAFLKENTSRDNTKRTLVEITMRVDPANYIFSVEEQQFYNKVSRILITYFLKGQYILCLLNSWKIKKTNKKDHLKVRRYLTLKLKQASHEIMEIYKILEQ